MPISFSSIPLHIKQEIVQKLELKDFTVFQTCSSDAYNTAKYVRTCFTIPHIDCNKIKLNFANDEILFNLHGKISRCLERMPLRFEAEWFKITCDLSANFCRRLIRYFQRSGSTANFLYFRENDGIDSSCSPETFSQLLHVAGSYGIMILRPTAAEYFRNFPLRVESIQVNCQFDDEDFVKSRRLTRLFVKGSIINSVGLNVVIKEWIEGKRNIKEIDITTLERFRKEDILRGIAFSYTLNADIFKVRNAYGSGFLKITLSEEASRCHLKFEYDAEYLAYYYCKDHLRLTGYSYYGVN